MTIEDKILANVKEQSLIHTRMAKMQTQFDELKLSLERKTGKMELLQELFQEQNGVTLGAYVQDNPSFKLQLDAASKEGEALAVGGADDVPVEESMSVNPSSGKGVVSHTANKATPPAVAGSVAAPDAAAPDNAVLAPTRSSNRGLPKIVVNDIPTPPAAESSEDAKDPSPK